MNWDETSRREGLKPPVPFKVSLRRHSAALRPDRLRPSQPRQDRVLPDQPRNERPRRPRPLQPKSACPDSPIPPEARPLSRLSGPRGQGEKPTTCERSASPSKGRLRRGPSVGRGAPPTRVSADRRASVLRISLHPSTEPARPPSSPSSATWPSSAECDLGVASSSGSASLSAVSSPEDEVVWLSCSSPDRDSGRGTASSTTEEEGSGCWGRSAAVCFQIGAALLRCLLCGGRLQEPTLLPCMHTFCRECIVKTTPTASIATICHSCNKPAVLPKQGVSGFPRNSVLNDLMEMLEDPVTAEPGASEDPEEQPKGSLCCSVHEGCALFCSTCEVSVCADCGVGDHHDHVLVDMAQAALKETDQIRRWISNARSDQISRLECGVSVVSARRQQVSTAHAHVTKDVAAVFDRLQAAVDARRSHITAQLNRLTAAKKQALDEQLSRLESELSSLLTRCEFLEQAMERASPAELIMVKRQVADEQHQDHHNQQDVIEPVENAHFDFRIGCIESLESSLSSFCSVSTSSALPSHTRVMADDDTLLNCIVGRTVRVNIQARDAQERVVGCPDVEQFLCELVPVSLRTRSRSVASMTSASAMRPLELSTELSEVGEGMLELAFSLPEEGEYRLHVTMLGHNIKGSPFKVVSSCPLGPLRPSLSSTWSSALSSTPSSACPAHRKQFRSRSHVLARPPSAKSFTSDSMASRTNPVEDDLILRIGARGRNRGEFANPQGVAVTPNGRILVTDSNLQCVQCFGPQGEVRLRFGTRGRGVGNLQRPTGVCAFTARAEARTEAKSEVRTEVRPEAAVRWAVADYENACVSIFDQTGRFINRIGVGKLLGPKGVCCNGDGNLVVVDNKASCVFVFTPSGKLVLRFGSRGADPHCLAGPHYVAVNSKGNYVVSDFHNHAIKVFDSSGSFVLSFGSNGEGNGQFNAPTGVAVDANDNILVADWGNSRLAVFDATGSFVAFVNTAACPLYGPQGLAVTPDGNVVVADSGNHCFKIYRYLQ